MKSRNLVKVIFFVSALINLSPTGKATELFANETRNSSQSKSVNWVKKVFPKYTNYSRNISFQKYIDTYSSDSKDKKLQTSRNASTLLSANSLDIKNELEIQSDIQSEENNILKAEGNVLVLYRGNILKTDSLVYDKTQKTIIAKGNISLSIGEQLFKMNRFQYDFNNEKGYLYEVKGLIKTDNLLDDLFSNFKTSDIKNIEILKEIKKDKVLNTPNKIEKWFFFTDRIEINGKKWKSDKAIFSNDLIELKQVKIEINSIEATSRKEELRFKSSLNRLILDEKVSIPFWVGDRTLTNKLSYSNKWNFGFDNTDKDGFFIGRKLNSINLFDEFIVDLEPQFLLQRSLKGNTKSFVNKGDSITGDKVKRETTLKDYFALNSQIKGKINNWKLETDQQISSFDSEKFSKALRFKSNLSKDISFLNSLWNKSFYGIYRERVWNGSIGETEIYLGYGSKLKKQNTWEVNGIRKTEILSFGFANIKAEALNNKNLVTSTKGNFFYLLDQKFPIIVGEPSNIFVDSSYRYIPKPIKRGLSLQTKLELLYSFYDSGNNQQYVSLGAGPEIVYGNFKKKFFDYTKISVCLLYTSPSPRD